MLGEQVPLDEGGGTSSPSGGSSYSCEDVEQPMSVGSTTVIRETPTRYLVINYDESHADIQRLLNGDELNDRDFFCIDKASLM